MLKFALTILATVSFSAIAQETSLASFTVNGKKMLEIVDKNKPNIQLAKILKVSDTDDVRSTNEYGETVLIESARNNNLTAMKMLVASNLYSQNDFSVVDKDGNSSFLYAVVNENIAMINFLANYVKIDDYDYANALGDSPVSIAKKTGGKIEETISERFSEAHKKTLSKLVVIEADNSSLILKRH
jgi:ankyrin repeat protein